uniref:C2 domain-containing protein n=1 Tax=Ascaris lumbricoides TaxID=6252 RepID=A0A0M3HJR7_ASCLU
MVRIYVVQTGGRVLKKKTSTQKVQNGEIIFNESVFINVSKSKIEVRLNFPLLLSVSYTFNSYVIHSEYGKCDLSYAKFWH